MRYFFLTVLLILISNVVVGNEGELLPVRWSSEIHLSSLADIPTRLISEATGKVTYIKQGQPVVAKSCQDYFNLTQQGFFPENNTEIAASSYFVKQCLPLKYLQQAQPAQISYVRNFVLAKDYGRFPAAIIMPSMAGENPIGTLGSAYPKCEVKQGRDQNTIELQSKQAGLTAHVSILAWGDFNHDGYDDLLIFVANYPYGHEGTYRAYQVYLLTQKSKYGSMMEISTAH